jgi:hypothetical protein
MHLAFISHHRLLRFRLRAAAAPLVPLPLPLPLLSLACDSDSGTGTDTGTPVMRSSAVSHGSPQLAHTRLFSLCAWLRYPKIKVLKMHLAFISHHRLLRFRLLAAAAPLVPLLLPLLPLPLLSLACDSDTDTGTGAPIMRSSAVSHGSPQLAQTRLFSIVSKHIAKC